MTTYGLKVFNNNDQVIIDSDEGFPHFIETSSTTINGGTNTEVVYPTNFPFNELIFARPTSTCMIMEAGNEGGTISSVTITSGGSGYSSAPTVGFSGGDGAGAAGTATISGGAVTGVSLTNVGSGYSSAPTLTFSGGGGSGAAGTVAGGYRAFYRSSASTVVQLLKAEVTSGNVANHNTGYGLNIFDGTGAASASTLVFSTNVSSSLDIKAIGSYNSIFPNHTITYDAEDSTEPHYVLLPGSFRYYWTESYGGAYGGASITQETNRGYKFNYNGNQLESIDILNKFMHNGTPAALSYGGGAYMIVKRRS